MRSVRDIAAVCALLLDELGVADVTVVGLGFGGYVAAEMATANQSRLDRLVLVNAMGLQPEDGEIRDQFLEAHADYVKSCFADPANFTALYGEEVCHRTARRLGRQPRDDRPHRLEAIPLQPDAPPPAAQRQHVKTRVDQGHARTRSSPPSVANQYVNLLGDAELIEINGGHHLESDAAEALAEAIVG